MFQVEINSIYLSELLINNILIAKHITILVYKLNTSLSEKYEATYNSHKIYFCVFDELLDPTKVFNWRKINWKALLSGCLVMAGRRALLSFLIEGIKETLFHSCILSNNGWTAHRSETVDHTSPSLNKIRIFLFSAFLLSVLSFLHQGVLANQGSGGTQN